MKNFNYFLNKFTVTLFCLFSLLLSGSIIVNAGYEGKGEVAGNVEGDIDISLSSISFDDHRGMKATINGEEVFCIQRGYPFRSKVSELQMVNVTVEGLVGDTHNGTIAGEIRHLLFSITDEWDAQWFRGWGKWTINGDHTDATQTSTDGAPSSSAWQEAFDEDKEDDEDNPYENRWQGSGSVRRWLSEVKPNLTGHEGCIEPFKTQMKKISYSDAGFNMSQVYALAMIHYYVYEDPDASSYSDDTKYQCEQAMDWGVEYGFIKTIGSTGTTLTLNYQDSSGYYGISRSKSYSGKCDGYIKTTIGGKYEAMKLYRQVVWKTTNMRMIPSFAADMEHLASIEPIKLYWDEEQNLYTATVSDANGVLDYFDFEIPGCTVTNNGDGTLTISTANKIGSSIISVQKPSRLEPEDGVFKLPNFYRWELEGKTVTFKYTVFMRERAANGTGGDVIWYEDGDGRAQTRGLPYEHSHNYNPACNWFCTIPKETITHCTNIKNSCTHDDNAGWENEYDDEGNVTGGHHTYHEHTSACHTHTIECQHQYDCPYWKKHNRVDHDTYVNAQPTGDCRIIWCCGKEHFKTEDKTLTGKYIDWQDVTGVYAEGQKIIDPTYAYIKVITVDHEFPAQTDTEVLLIADNDEWNDLIYTLPDGTTQKHCSHLRVGEKYSLMYIYSYTGGSKGFRIEFSTPGKTYYQYNYLARMQSPYNVKIIYDLRNGLSSDRFSKSSVSVPHAKLVIDKTPIKIYGSYTTAETAYTLNGTYTWSSGDTLANSSWNDSIYLDALTTDQYDDNYNNKAADNYAGANGGEMITSSNSASEFKDFRVTKQDDNIQVIWIYETEPEVFSSAVAKGTAFIEVGENDNYTKTYYDEAYNYAKEDYSGPFTHFAWGFEEHNKVGGVGYFSSEYTDPNGTQSNNLIPSHTVYTQNNEDLTYSLQNKVWQSDVDIKVSNFVQNTGAGITESTYQEKGLASHMVNYNLYYTIVVENPKATLEWDKIKQHDGTNETTNDSQVYNTSSETNEFDVNTLISWGDSKDVTLSGATIVVDHIKTGTTYLQRTVPNVINTISDSGNSNPTATKSVMTMKVYPNYDRLIYEDAFRGVTKTGSAQNFRYQITLSDSLYPSNEQKAVSDIFAAIDPNTHKPTNILSSGNVPNTRDDEHRTYGTNGATGTTSFSMKLADGSTKTIKDSLTKNYKQYDFTYNTDKRDNKVTFGSNRKSITFFKYSKTNYSYNGKTVNSGTGVFNTNAKTQTESYYISQVLFKSNYTTKYQKELEEEGADYIVEELPNGQKETWIDMVNQNKYAIVAAGQGFELKVTVKYENSLLTQYLARYFGTNDAQNQDVGTSYPNTKYLGPQYCNISSMTGFLTYAQDGKNHAYINGINTIDRLAVNLVTGSNVYKDLYCFMSDNPEAVYSYSGIYNTPTIFERQIIYSKDFSTTTIIYTMSVSTENGVSSSFQNMKFFTDQLASDKKTPGIVENNYNVENNGEHSITLWTPIVAATGFDYPDTIQERYIGDAIELGYTIKTTGADDSIVHIVQ